MFVHFSAIEVAVEYRTLEEGQTVEFEVTQGPKGLQASGVQVVDPAGREPVQGAADPPGA